MSPVGAPTGTPTGRGFASTPSARSAPHRDARENLFDPAAGGVPAGRAGAERPAGCSPPPAAAAHTLARRRPPNRSGLEPVGKYHDRSNWRDIDYVVSRSAAGDALIALLADEVGPTVVVRRYSTGDTDLLTSFGM
jgi:hypothetical protein